MSKLSISHPLTQRAPLFLLVLLTLLGLLGASVWVARAMGTPPGPVRRVNARTTSRTGALTIRGIRAPSGSGVFNDSGQTLGSSWSKNVALGDLDGDGDLDAFVANDEDAPNTVWLNNGAGTFSDSGQTLGSLGSNDVALGDLDGDGDLDAFVANDFGDPNTVWLNDGGGTFSDSGQALGSSSPSIGVALGDLDGDGDLDAFVANDFGNPNTVWLNNGGGTFSDSDQTLGSSSSLGVALGDLDGDGDLDAFVVNDFGDPNTVWLNNGGGIFSDSGQLLENSDSTGVALGDLDGDSDLDAFVVNFISEPNRVWVNDGAGNFSDSGQTLGSSDSFGVGLGDLDGDSDLDAFVANFSFEPNTVWINDGGGTFSDSGQTLGSSDSFGVTLGDLDGDSDLDAFVANSSGEPNTVWVNINQVDLALGKTASPGGAVTAGDVVNYTLTATNNGSQDATGVVVSDRLPQDAVFLSASPGCTEASGTVTCVLGTLTASSSQDVMVSVQAWSRTETLVNAASISSSDPETNPADNTVIYSQPIMINADLELNATPSTMNPTKGTEFSYEMDVTNFGPADAYQVTLFDQLPEGVDFIGVTSIDPNENPPNCTEAGGLVTCFLDNLDNTPHLLRGHFRAIRMNVMAEQDNVDVTANEAWVCAVSPDPDTKNNGDGPCYRLFLPLILR